MTFAELIAAVQTELGQASGPDVQTYAEPRVAAMLQRTFNQAFQDKFWNRFVNYDTYALDGTTGEITTNVASLIKEFNDIGSVWYESYRNPLPLMPKDVNPAIVTQMCLQPSASATTHGFFKVRPLTTTGNITVMYRTAPTAFVDSDEVPFDPDYMVLKSVVNFLVVEGTNLKAAEFYAKAAKDIWDGLVALDERDKSLHSMTISNIDNWQTI